MIIAHFRPGLWRVHYIAAPKSRGAKECFGLTIRNFVMNACLSPGACVKLRSNRAFQRAGMNPRRPP
jgi:hypothetical protein